MKGVTCKAKPWYPYRSGFLSYQAFHNGSCPARPRLVIDTMFPSSSNRSNTRITLLGTPYITRAHSGTGTGHLDIIPRHLSIRVHLVEPANTGLQPVTTHLGVTHPARPGTGDISTRTGPPVEDSKRCPQEVPPHMCSSPLEWPLRTHSPKNLIVVRGSSLTSASVNDVGWSQATSPSIRAEAISVRLAQHKQVNEVPGVWGTPSVATTPHGSCPSLSAPCW